MNNSYNTAKVKARNANMDILRIVSMLLIVFLHSIDHSGVLEAVEKNSPMYYYVQYGYFLSQVCVNCFVLLSGYFMVKSRFRPSKLISLWLEVVVYSFVIRAAFMIFGKTPFSIVSLVSCFVPVLTGRYWFITIYFGLYLLSPFLNMAIKAMTKRQFTALNALLILLMSCWSSIHPSMAGMNSGGGWGLAWFVVLYCVAAWMRLYYNKNDKVFLKTVAFFAIPLGVVAFRFVANYFEIGILNSVINNWYKYDSILATVLSLILMAIFININAKNPSLTKIATKIAPLTLGVYLIHAHADFAYSVWTFTDIAGYTKSWLFPIVQISMVLGVFLICIAIDAIRNYIFKFIKLSKLYSWIDNKFKDIIGIIDE